MRFNDFTPEARTTALYYYFGQIGGTVHQLAQLTGLSVSDILYRQDDAGGVNGGFSAVRTCSTEWRRDTLAPRHKGDWLYWRDVIRGFWITGPLCKEMAARMAGPVTA